MSRVRGKEDRDCIRLVQDEDQWRLLVGRVLNLDSTSIKDVSFVTTPTNIRFSRWKLHNGINLLY
jgi:hypothetical protein